MRKLFDSINRFELKQFYKKHIPNRIKRINNNFKKLNSCSKPGLKRFKRDINFLLNPIYSTRKGVFIGGYCLDNKQRIGRKGKLKIRKPTDGSSPIIEYQMGPNDRIEYLSARVKLAKAHLLEWLRE